MFSRCSGVYTVLEDLVIAYRLIHVFLERFANDATQEHDQHG
jgi:hypothetical protein